MKQLLTYVQLLTSCIAFSQKFYSTPKFDFSGVSILWHNRPTEMCYDSANLYWTPIRCGEKMQQYLAHIVSGNKVYFLLDNEGKYTSDGSTLICYNYNNGDSLWQMNYRSNLQSVSVFSMNPNEYSFRYRNSFELNEDGIDLLGYGDFSKHINIPVHFDRGFFSYRKISTLNGSDINHVFNTNYTERFRGSYNLPIPIIKRKNQYFYYILNGLAKIDPEFTQSFRPVILNDTFSGVQLDEKFIGFKDAYIESKIHPAVLENDSTYIYFASWPSSNYRNIRHYFWKVNYKGDYWNFKEITEKIGGTDKKNWIDDIVKVGNSIRLKITTPFQNFDTINGHQGYLYLDFNGNIVKDQRALMLDGKPVGHIITTPIFRTKDLLHVVRFINEHDIYFYKENPMGEFLQVGKMSLNNPSIYAFLPKFIVQDKEGNFALTFDTRLINIPDTTDLLLGGWPFICKIKGSDLKIPTDLISNKTDEIDIHYNSTSKRIFVHSKLPLNTDYHIVNIMGQELVKGEIKNTSSSEISLENFPVGLYKLILTQDQKVFAKQIHKLE